MVIFNSHVKLPEGTTFITFLLGGAGSSTGGFAASRPGNLYMWGLGSYGRLGLGEVMDVPLARRTSEHHGSLGFFKVCYPLVN